MTRDCGSVTVERGEMIEFARRYDPQPIHIDEETARKSVFGGLIASGWFTVGLSTRLLVEEFMNDIAGMGGRGTDDLRWPHPVRAGDTLSVSLEVVDAHPVEHNPSYGLIKTAFETTNHDDETVLSMVGLLYVARRDDLTE